MEINVSSVHFQIIRLEQELQEQIWVKKIAVIKQHTVYHRSEVSRSKKEEGNVLITTEVHCR